MTAQTPLDVEAIRARLDAARPTETRPDYQNEPEGAPNA